MMEMIERMGQRADFEQANRAFELFTLAERELALEEFARLRYPSIIDRFFEAVYSVIRDKQQSEDAVDPVDGRVTG